MSPIGGSKPDDPKPLPPPPTEAAPEVAIAKANERERLKRAKGRAFSQVTEPAARKSSDGNILKRSLGGA